MEIALILIGLGGGLAVFATALVQDMAAGPAPEDGPTRLPQVAARIACPESGGIKRVRIASVGAGAAPTIVWCDRFAHRPVTCAQQCLQSPALYPN